MSICVYGRIKKTCINEILLERFLAEFFLPQNDIIKKNNGKCVSYENVCGEKNVTISFVSEKKPPYNVYDSNIIDDKFEYIQLILFEVEKEEATIDNYKEIIRFFIYLNENLNSDILVTSDAHDEICLLKKAEIVWAKGVLFSDIL